MDSLSLPEVETWAGPDTAAHAMAMPRRHFIADLRRAGSTLLTGLLRQNTRLHARINSPIACRSRRLLAGMSEKAGGFLDDGQRHRTLRALFGS